MCTREKYVIEQLFLVTTLLTPVTGRHLSVARENESIECCF